MKEIKIDVKRKKIKTQRQLEELLDSFSIPMPKLTPEGEKLKKLIFQIIDEHKAACAKHPKFCDRLCESGGWSMVEKHYKEYNDNCKEYLGNMLFLEEFSEALHAYDQGDKKHCLQELAQCGAVILRMMEFVKNEMEAR